MVRNLFIEMLALHDSINFRKFSFSGFFIIFRKVSFYKILFPSFFKVIPRISYIQLYFSSSCFDILLCFWQYNFDQSSSPLFWWNTVYSEVSKTCRNYTSEITYRVVMGHSTRLNRYLYYLLQRIINETNASSSHRCTAPASRICKWNLIPITPICIQNFNRFSSGLSWCSSTHISPTFLIFDSKLPANCIKAWIFFIGNQCFSSSNMHNCIITITPFHINFQFQRTLIFCNLLHLLVYDFTTFLELPISIFITHSITYSSQQHDSDTFFFPIILAFHNLICFLQLYTYFIEQKSDIID